MISETNKYNKLEITYILNCITRREETITSIYNVVNHPNSGIRTSITNMIIIREPEVIDWAESGDRICKINCTKMLNSHASQRSSETLVT